MKKDKRTGKKAKDIFARTTKPPGVGLEVAPRVRGRPGAKEPYQKVTVCLFDRHILFLDKVALAIREKNGRYVKRAELVRALVDRAAGQLDPGGTDFVKAVGSLLDEKVT